MKNTIRQVFHSPKFIVGFVIFALMLLTVIVYPVISPGNPLQMLSKGSFLKPGIYFSVYDSINAESKTIDLPKAGVKRLANKLSNADKVSMVQWLTSDGVPAEDIDMQDTTALIKLWQQKYDPTVKPEGMTMAQRNFYKRLDKTLENALNEQPLVVSVQNTDTQSLDEVRKVADTDYVNLKDVDNVKVLPLGTDNFGDDVLKKLVSATKTSLVIGLIAGAIATFIGLTLGLLAGYLGGLIDDFIMFITNLFTVIPSFVLLILISYSIGQDKRGAATVAIVIGITSWVWTTRSVRSQVISLRNRDHVNLSKLSGHSLASIIIKDILPYIASYVVMAFILQISTAILSEASLSMIGLGPKTADVSTLGLMMYWAMSYSAHLNGAWWAYFPVILVIALISFSLNLMNTGLDQVFNPTLRD